MNEERTWDLSILVEDTSIEGVTRAADSALSELNNVIEELRGSSREVHANQLLELIQKVERAFEKITSIAAYSHCKY
ncbi:MAG: hypothetical protein ACTSRE_17035, partial [Promethearchaeota archaeon]